MQLKLRNIRRVLFITLSNIGDVILTLPVLSALKDNLRGARVDVVVGPRPRDVFIKDRGLGRIFIYDKHAGLKEKILFLKKLRREHYDLAVDMRGSLIPILIGAGKRTALMSIDRGKVRHKRMVHLNRLKALGIQYEERQNIYIDSEDRKSVEGLLEKNRVRKEDIILGVSPACRSPLKQWDAGGFIEVIRGFLKEGNHKIVLVGDPSQVHIARTIKDAVRDEGLVDLIGKTSLNQLFALIERMHVFLTGDSASLHIASDLGIRTVALFGPTDPEEYGPWGKGDIVIRKKLRCSPCRKAVCAFNHECMKQIRPDEVLEALNRALS